MNFWRFAWENCMFMNNLSVIPEFELYECAETTAEIVAEIEHAMESGDVAGLEQYIEAIYEVWDHSGDDDALEILHGWHWIVREALELTEKFN